jgi:2,4-dienoyl-CoA reductase-like NADH-dependent reductase (Old Yellow Enzyme family)
MTDLTSPPKISDPLTLPCGAILPNRLCKAAMTEGLADPDNAATARHATLYKTWAEGGAGLSITGNIMVDRRYLERAGNLAIDGEQSPAQMRGLEAYATAGRAAGGHIWVQISHAGRQSPKAIATEPVAPSAVGEVALPGGLFAKPRALTGIEIEDVIERFVHASAVSKEAGFTGVQIHAAHGYLISEFLNPLINQRDDEWGGDLDGRSRLLLTIIDRVRKRVGRDYPVGVKLNSSDFQKGGFSLDDCIGVVKRLEAAGVDLIEISGGNYEQPQMMGIDGLEPVYQDAAMVRASTRDREAYFLNYAAAIRRECQVPLMVTGGFRRRSAMEAALREDGIAMIGVARPLCVDPDLCTKLINGKVDVMPSWESSLSIGPGWLGPRSSNATIQALNGFANMAFFYRNIIRLAENKPPKPRMNLLGAFIKHQMTDADDAKKLHRR